MLTNAVRFILLPATAAPATVFDDYSREVGHRDLKLVLVTTRCQPLDG
jgi:hypothetical protein